MRWLFIVALLAGCSSSKSSPPAAGSGSASRAAPGAPARSTERAPADVLTAQPGKASSMTKFTLNVDGEPPVAVELAVPSGWRADGSPDPTWSREGALMLSLVAVSPSGDDDQARVNRAIRMQYDAVGADERTDLPDGRVWIAHREGENLHARMFVPYPGGVVMGVAILGAEGAGALPEVRAAFETLTIAR
mgnify:CR=1 FL=1